MELGKPIGHQTSVPSTGTEQGEHGAGVGLSGGHSHATAQNTQSGLSGAGHGHSHSHATDNIPTGTPIADKFTTSGHGQNSVAGAYAGGATGDGLTGQSNAHRTGAGVGYDGENLPTSHASAASGAHSHSHGTHGHDTSGGAVSGAYESGAIRGDALTGESHAHRTGAGVGPLGENLSAGHTAGSHSHPHATEAALASTAAGAAAGAGYGATHSHSQSAGNGVGVGVGPSGGAGGHYTVPSSTSTGISSGAPSGVSTGGLGSGTGASGAGVLDAQRAGAQAHREGHSINSGTAAGVGAGALGAGALGAGAASATGSHGQGHGTTSSSVPSTTNERGAPVSDPKELDNGGRHGLILDPATGKYVHRHEVDETSTHRK